MEPAKTQTTIILILSNFCLPVYFLPIKTQHKQTKANPINVSPANMKKEP